MDTERSVDIVVYGATGLTGKFVFEELSRLMEENAFTLGIGGRDVEKLEALLESCVASVKKEVKIFKANVNDSEELLKMTGSCRLIVNCVGPFRFYGEQVVSACVQTRTNYIDISGETEFIENMYLRYDDSAIQNGITVISACGFDSVPADIGTIYSVRQLDLDVVPYSVESFIEIHTDEMIRLGFSTYESAIYGISEKRNVRNIQEKIRRKEGSEEKKSCARSVSRFSPTKYPFFEGRVHKWAMLFPGCDAFVVKRTQTRLSKDKKRHVQYAGYFGVDFFMNYVIILILGFIINILSFYKIGRYILLKYPDPFTAGVVSRDEPTRREIEKTTFQINFFATGFREVNDKTPSKVETHIRMEGKDPGYLFTSMCVSQAALCFLQNEHRIKRGVLTPGVAFYETDFVERLTQNGLKISVVKS